LHYVGQTISARAKCLVIKNILFSYRMILNECQMYIVQYEYKFLMYNYIYDYFILIEFVIYFINAWKFNTNLVLSWSLFIQSN